MLDYEPLDRCAVELGCEVLRNEQMALHTTFKIGGPADRFISVKNEKQLTGLLKLLGERSLPYYVLGNGSNLLISDKGMRCAVLYLAGDFKKLELLPDGKTVRAGAAASLSSLCAFARDKGLSGLEFAWGIPGFVGGAAYMNAGAYGGEMKDVISKVRHISKEGVAGEAAGGQLEFSYRKSRYTGKTDIIIYAEYVLEPGDTVQIGAKMEEHMKSRKSKQPYDMPSAGSIFKRPKDGYAAAMIEACGLKGVSVGGAQVSPKHAGFIVNTGGASCADVENLIELIKDRVKEKTGTLLECEVRITGEV